MNVYIHEPSGTRVTTASIVRGDGWVLVSSGDETKAERPRTRRGEKGAKGNA